MEKKKVMIVEDESIVANDIKVRLQSFGYEVPSVVSTGEEAIKIVEEISPDLLLMDIVLGGEIDGIKTVKQIRSRLDIPVIYLTAYADDKTIDRAKVTAPYGYIIKPFGDRELQTTIEIALYKHWMEKKLKENEERFHKVVTSAPIVLWALDHNGIFTLSEGKGLEALGLKPGDVVGQSVFDVYKDTPQIIDETKRALSGEEITSLVKVGPRTYEARYSPVKSPAGDVVGVIGVATDVTERAEAEVELKDSFTFLQYIIDSVSEPIMVISTDYTTRMINKAARNLPGSSSAHLCYRASHNTDFPCSGEFHPCPLEAVRDSGKQVTVTHIHTTPGGERRFIEISASPLLALDGKFQGIIEVQRDITERKKMEEELLKTQKLESLGIIAGGIAHDFNNLLTAILGNISLSKMYAGPGDKTFERLTMAENACMRARDLTQQLLVFSRSSAPVKESITLGSLIKDSVRFSLSGSRVECKYDLVDDLWPVRVDKGQFSQVIHNIVLNAIDAMKDGGTITIGADNIVLEVNSPLPLEKGKYVQIFLQDQGIGIAEENLPRVFDPYYSTKEMGPQKGMGLGLALCYSIVKDHDGLITVESKLGAGTTFHIYLPVSEDEPTRKAIRKEREEKFTAGKGKILLLDDEEIVREVASEMLHMIGYEGTFVSSGDEAIELYKKAQEAEKPFDAVILDLTIRGGFGGKEVIKRLLALDPNVKAIVSSGYADNPIMANFGEYGFKGVVTKPYNVEELSEILEAILKQ